MSSSRTRSVPKPNILICVCRLIRNKNNAVLKRYPTDTFSHKFYSTWFLSKSLLYGTIYIYWTWFYTIRQKAVRFVVARFNFNKLILKLYCAQVIDLIKSNIDSIHRKIENCKLEMRSFVDNQRKCWWNLQILENRWKFTFKFLLICLYLRIIMIRLLNT